MELIRCRYNNKDCKLLTKGGKCKALNSYSDKDKECAFYTERPKEKFLSKYEVLEPTKIEFLKGLKSVSLNCRAVSFTKTGIKIDITKRVLDSIIKDLEEFYEEQNIIKSEG